MFDISDCFLWVCWSINLSFWTIIDQRWVDLLVFYYSLFLCFSPFLIKIIDFSHFCLRCPRCPIRQLRRPKSSCRYPEIIILSTQRGQTLNFWGKFREQGVFIKVQRWEGEQHRLGQSAKGVLMRGIGIAALHFKRITKDTEHQLAILIHRGCNLKLHIIAL